MIREDLRQLLTASWLYLDTAKSAGELSEAGAARLKLAMDRIASTASSAEWQPKYKPDD